MAGACSAVDRVRWSLLSCRSPNDRAKRRMTGHAIQEEMQMKVRIDANLCQGHAMCALACPRVFQLSDEDGHAWVEDEEVPAEFEDAVEQAVRSCPEGAIATS